MTDTLKQAEALVLLPCPFCGGVAELNHSHTIYPHIVCTSEACQACGPALYSAEAAIESWNTRAALAQRDDAPVGMVAQYTFGEIAYAWGDAGIDGDWDEFIGCLGTGSRDHPYFESAAPTKPTPLATTLGLSEPIFPSLKRLTATQENDDGH